MVDSLQTRFAGALLAPAQPVPAGIKRADGGDPALAFAIYRNNVAISLVDTLKSGFPAVYRLLGDARFRALALAFIRTRPPRSPVLLHYGADFPAFLKKDEAGHGLAYLADLANLEWMRIEAHHARDAQAVGIEILMALEAAAMQAARLILHPSLRLVRSRHSIVSLHAVETGLSPRARNCMLLDTPQDGLVIRPRMSVEIHLLGEGLGAFVAALLWGSPLGLALEAGLEEDASFDVSGALGFLFSAGCVIGLNSLEADVGDVIEERS